MMPWNKRAAPNIDARLLRANEWFLFHNYVYKHFEFQKIIDFHRIASAAVSGALYVALLLLGRNGDMTLVPIIE